MRTKLFMLLAVLLIAASPIYAADGAGGTNWVALTSGFSMAIASAGCGIAPRMTFGYATFPEHGKTCESLFLKANTNRFADKVQGAETAAEAGGRPAGRVIPFRA